MSETLNSSGFFELGSDDPQRTEEFYGSLFGWNFGPGHGRPYTFITLPNGRMLGALWDTTEEPGTGLPPNYIVNVIEVADVEDTVRRATEAGGTVVISPTRIEQGTHFAYLRDPAGLLFAVATPVAEQQG
ncbi:VOC family protein [Saccharomonospora xinjiangensis]|uniref:VOC family protein n=1 Tax=Saccharomonospora xinjiangensis TaxID=75294 RepID=UPI00350F6E36